MFKSLSELQAGLDYIKCSPKITGTVELIVRRPHTNQREVVELAELEVTAGLVGDNWLSRGYKKTPDGSAHPDMQINIMNARCIALIAGAPENWPPAGDQFYVDFDLSKDNLPPGTLLQLGSAQLEVTSEPHLGCRKFQDRFGKDAVRFVNSSEGKLLNLRGINAKVVQPGKVRKGDAIIKNTVSAT